jgi:hypothetical protein
VIKEYNPHLLHRNDAYQLLLPFQKHYCKGYEYMPVRDSTFPEYIYISSLKISFNVLSLRGGDEIQNLLNKLEQK